MSESFIDKTGNSESSLIEHIVKAIKSIRYGYVQITIQDSRVVQIEKTEKFRVNSRSKP